MGIESWSTSAGSNNQAPPNGWPGGMLPSQVEPTGRQMMASLASWYQAAEWINYNFPIVYSSATVFTIASNATATYHVGRRVQATDGSTSVFGTITASVFTSLTTVTVVWDTGVLQTGVTIVYVGITSKVNTSAPIQALTSAAFANPSASIGLAAVNGTATTAMTSDSAPALSQAISPTWSGTHTFTNPITVNGAGSSIKGSVAIAAPATAVTTLTVTGQGPNVNTVNVVSAQGTSGTGGDLLVSRAGSTANAFGGGPCLVLSDSTNVTDTLLQNAGGQSELWQFNGSWQQILKVLTTRGMVINTPASGTALAVSGITDVSQVIRSTGGSAPAAGLGLEISSDGTSGFVTSFNRSGGTYIPLLIRSSTTTFQQNGNTSIAVTAAGAVSVAAAASANTLTVNGAVGNVAGFFIGSATTSNSLGMLINAGTNSSDYGLQVNNSSGGTTFFKVRGDGVSLIGPTATQLTVSGGSAVTVTAQAQNVASSSFGMLVSGGTNASDYSFACNNAANSIAYFKVAGNGVVSGNDGTSLFELGYKDIPQNAQSSSYGLALSDRGKEIYASTSGVTYTIPANGSVAFPIGSTIVVTNDSAGNISIAITTDTLAWMQGGSTSTGTRTIALGSVVTLRKVTATRWTITGLGIS